jgi:hypothetical protein
MMILPRLRNAFSVLFLFAGIVSAIPAWADIVFLNPNKDNTLYQNTNATSQTSNGQGDITVGRTNQATASIRRGLIAFDFSSIPTNAVISSVQLTLTEAQGLNGNQTVTLYRAIEDWGEGSSIAANSGQGIAAQAGDATWLYRSFNFADPAQSTAWSTPGGVYSSTASASTTVTSGSANQAFSWSSTQMASDVQLWLQSPSSNFGWVLVGNESLGQTSKRFVSGESSTFAPTLTVNFSVTSVPEPSSLAIISFAALGIGFEFRRRRKDLP